MVENKTARPLREDRAGINDPWGSRSESGLQDLIDGRSCPGGGARPRPNATGILIGEVTGRRGFEAKPAGKQPGTLGVGSQDDHIAGLNVRRVRSGYANTVGQDPTQLK
jgi:hypothetical protein